MHRFKCLFLLGSVLLVASLLLTVASGTSTAFAATTGMHNASRASTITYTASSSLVPDACPPTCANPINACPPGQSEGASTNNPIWVKVIQFRLNDLSREGEPGLGILSVDGSFEQHTEAAVAQFQQDENIQGGGGAVGNRTWSALGFCPGDTATFGISGTTSRTNCPPPQSNGGSGNDANYVQAIQDLLNLDFSAGVFTQSPDSFSPYLASDGMFESLTQNAVSDFQQSSRVGISGGGGAVGQRTWSELGMCY